MSPGFWKSQPRPRNEEAEATFSFPQETVKTKGLVVPGPPTLYTVRFFTNTRCLLKGPSKTLRCSPTKWYGTWLIINFVRTKPRWAKLFRTRHTFVGIPILSPGCAIEHRVLWLIPNMRHLEKNKAECICLSRQSNGHTLQKIYGKRYCSQETIRKPWRKSTNICSTFPKSWYIATNKDWQKFISTWSACEN